MRLPLEASYVDANYWIYWFDERLPEHRLVDGTMEKAIQEGVVVSTVTLMEIAHYFRDLPQAELSYRMETIVSLSTLNLIDFSLATLRSSVNLLSEYSRFGLGSRDCVILATMKEVGTKVLLTHDKAFKRVKDIRVVDEIV